MKLDVYFFAFYIIFLVEQQIRNNSLFPEKKKSADCFY